MDGTAQLPAPADPAPTSAVLQEGLSDKQSEALIALLHEPTIAQGGDVDWHSRANVAALDGGTGIQDDTGVTPRPASADFDPWVIRTVLNPQSPLFARRDTC